MTLGAGCWWTLASSNHPARASSAPSALTRAPWLLLPQGTPPHPEAWYLLLTKVASIKKGKRPKPRARPACGARPALLWGLDNYQHLLLSRHPRGMAGPRLPVWLLGTWSPLTHSLLPAWPSRRLEKLPQPSLAQELRADAGCEVWGGVWRGTACLGAPAHARVCGGGPTKTRGKAGDVTACVQLGLEAEGGGRSPRRRRQVGAWLWGGVWVPAALAEGSRPGHPLQRNLVRVDSLEVGEGQLGGWAQSGTSGWAGSPLSPRL